MYEIMDPKKLSDEEVQQKCRKLNQMIMAYRQTGHMAMIQSMEITLAILEEEWEYRMHMKADSIEKERNKQIDRVNSKRKKGSVKPPIKKTDTITIGFIKGVDDC